MNTTTTAPTGNLNVSLKQQHSTTVVTTITPTTNGDADTHQTILICSIVGGFLFLVIIFLVCLHCYKKRRLRKDAKKQTVSSRTEPLNTDEKSSSTGFVYDNRALQASQDIDLEVGSEQVEKRNSLIPQCADDDDIQTSSRKNEFSEKGTSQDVDVKNQETGAILGRQNSDTYTWNLSSSSYNSDKTTYDVSIKLMTPWVPVYAETDSNDFQLMKKLVQDSEKGTSQDVDVKNQIDALYIDFNDFHDVTLQRFRQGSVIADLQLEFLGDTANPLRTLQKAVQSGRFAQLEVDKSFFQVRHRIDVDVDGVPPVLRTTREANGSLTRSQRMESGYYGSQYGSQNFDTEAFMEHAAKRRETSQRSTTSIESNTSDFGTSHSVSPKSLSSTNISVYSHPEDEPRKEKSLLQGLMSLKLRDKSRNGHKLAIPHIALFDFSPQDQRELALKQNELITVTVVDHGGWVKARNNKGNEGWVPQNFVAPFDPVQYAATKETVESLMYLDGVIHSIDQVPGAVKTSSRSSSEDDDDVELNKDESNSASLDSDSISGLFITIFPNTGETKNELPLEVGDLVDVLKTSETGWWKGCSLRTHEVGWFPSSYVRPQTADLDITEFVEDNNDVIDKGTVSDSEVDVVRTMSFHKQKQKDGQDGYSSEDGMSRSRTNTASSKKEKGTSQDVDVINQKSAINNNELGALRKSSLEAPTTVIRRSSLKSCREDVAHHRVSFLTEEHPLDMEYANVEPPCKPVPPKPRKSHLKHTYQNLMLSGKLGSTESLKTRSTECLATYNSIRHKHDRRNSEELTVHGRNLLNSKPIDRARPRSFQENPKSSFFYLANRYASSMKSAWSFPTLVGDQINLSPDDERPYLVPIPRKSRHKRSQERISKLVDSPPKNIADEDLRSVGLYNKPTLRKSSSGCLSAHTVCVNIPTDNEDDTTQQPTQLDTKNHEKIEKTEIKNNMITKPVIAPKPSIVPPVQNKPTISPKPPPAPKRSSSKNITQKFMEDLIRNSDNQTSLSRNTDATHTRHPNRLSRNLNQLHFASFGPINEESEHLAASPDGLDKALHRRYHSEPHDGSFNILTKLAVREHLHNTNSPHTDDQLDELTPTINIMNADSNTNNSPPRALSPAGSENNDTTAQFRAILNNKTFRKHEKLNDLTATSRTSSMQSLASSLASSSRSTTSSKHEQLNLRKAIMDVYGQGENDLSFKAGSILYELRPKNKDGYCYGLLEDSTQGFYPAKAVHIFKES